MILDEMIRVVGEVKWKVIEYKGMEHTPFSLYTHRHTNKFLNTPIFLSLCLTFTLQTLIMLIFI